MPTKDKWLHGFVRQMKLMEVKESVSLEENKKRNVTSHMMTAYINIKGDKSESEKKKKYIFILFKITKKGLITFITNSLGGGFT